MEWICKKCGDAGDINFCGMKYCWDCWEEMDERYLRDGKEVQGEAREYVKGATGKISRYC